MPRKLANALLILVLLIVAVVSWQWLDDRENNISSQSATVAMAENETDYTLQDFVITNVNAQGKVYRLSGNSLSHFVNGNPSVIERPQVQMQGRGGQIWSGNAIAGYLSSDYSSLQLAGDVALSHKRTDNPPVNVSAEALRIDAENRQMTSDQPVTISGEKWSFKANQMQADVDNGILQFKSGVEAHYAVQP